MFPPATALSFPGSLDQARSLANTDKKWVLCNIQDHTEFASHMLNRDTWVNETLEEVRSLYTIVSWADVPFKINYLLQDTVGDPMLHFKHSFSICNDINIYFATWSGRAHTFCCIVFH